MAQRGSRLLVVLTLVLSACSSTPVESTGTRAAEDSTAADDTSTTSEAIAVDYEPLPDDGRTGFDPLAWRVAHGLSAPPPPPDAPSELAVGDTHEFNVGDASGSRRVVAELSYVDGIVAMWFEVGTEPETEAGWGVADWSLFFGDTVRARVGEFFGSERSPGIDNSPVLHILHVASLPGAAGQFSSGDEFPVEIEPDSNEREMFYVSLADLEPGSDDYFATLAHEYQHMIQWNNDPNEAGWMDEGLGQLAELVAGYSNVDAGEFLARTDTQLNSWSDGALATSYLRNYGAGFLFLLYLWERFGDEPLQALARHPAEGLEGVHAVIAPLGVTVDGVFSDWIVANLLDDSGLGDGRFGYELAALRAVCPRLEPTLPAQLDEMVPQYSARYVDVTGVGDFDLSFQGSPVVAAVPTTAASGNEFWWSGRSDRSIATLTREFDLTGLSAATLEFASWYDIESYLDFGVVSVSRDGGVTWEIVESDQTVFAPDIDEYPSYTGISGSRGQPEWVVSSSDLAAFAGGVVLVRFEYVTDTFHSRAGWAIDDIAVPELGYDYDAETGDGGWVADGFIRTDNRLEQRWSLQIVSHRGSVISVPVDADGGAVATFRHASPGDRSTIVIGGTADDTNQKASYSLAIDGGDGAAPPRSTTDHATFFDGFTGPCGGWRLYDDGSSSVDIEGEQLVIDVRTPQWSAGTTSGFSLMDVVIEADIDVSSLEDGAATVTCRENFAGDGYEFDLTGDGFFAVWTVTDGEYEAIVDYTASGAIDIDGSNHVVVRCIGDMLTFAINGDEVASLVDTGHVAGEVGLWVAAFDAGDVTARFDNVSISARPRSDALFFDDFSELPGTWALQDEADYRSIPADGSLLLEVDVPETVTWASHAESFGDALIEAVTITASEPHDNAWGVICRLTDREEFYSFEIDGIGQFAVNLKTRTGWETLIDWTPAAAIKAGAGATNHIVVGCIGNALTFIVNGTLLAEVDDDRLTEGAAGVVASTYSRGGVAALFDDFRVFAP